MAQVFVCYDREDRDFAEVVQAKLEKVGHTVAMDLDILSAGDDWQDKLDLAIRGSHAVVVIMTPQARVSDYVAYEWAFALGAGVKVIPVELSATSFSPRLEGLHRLNFMDKARPWEVLLAELQKAEASNPLSTIEVDANASPAIKKAVRSIDSLDPEERVAGIKTLTQIDSPTAREALLRALQHPVMSVRATAALLFPDQHDPRIVLGLADWYRDELQRSIDARNWDNRPSFSAKVVGIGAPAVPALLSLCREGADTFVDRSLRAEILTALGQIGDASVMPLLVEELKNTDEDIRMSAAKALGQLGNLGAAVDLRTALSDEILYVREEAAESLGLLKDTEAVPELTRILREDGKRMRKAAATALGRIGTPAAVPALIEAVEDEDYSVKGAAVEMVGRLGDTSAIPGLRRLLADMSDDGRIGDLDLEVMIALLRLNDIESFPFIEGRIVNFSGGSVPIRVCEELGRCGEPGVAVLIRILGSANDRIRESVVDAAAEVLAALRSPEASEVLKAWRRRQD